MTRADRSGGWRVASLLCLVIGVQIATLWNSPFRLDDIRQIPAAKTKLAEEINLVAESDSVFDKSDRNRFRPMLWGYFCLLNSLGGEPYSPRVYYLSGMALNILVALLSWRLLICMGCEAGRAWIFVVMAVANPSGVQAVYWIAAHADVLMVLIAVASLLAQFYGWTMTSGALCGSLVLCKSTAPALMVVVLALIQVARGTFNGRSTLRWSVAVVLIGLPGWLWRSTYIGNFLPTRPGAVEASLSDVASNMGAAFSHATLDLLTAGLTHYLQPSRHLAMGLTGALLLILLVIMAKRTRVFGLRRCVWFAVAFAASMLPFAFGFIEHSTSDHTIGRMLYLPFLLWAGFACVALPVRVHWGLLSLTLIGCVASSLAYVEGSKIVLSEMRAIEGTSGRAVIGGISHWHHGFPLVGAHYVDLYDDSKLVEVQRAVLTCDGVSETTWRDWLRDEDDRFITMQGTDSSWKPVVEYRDLIDSSGRVLLSNLGTWVDSVSALRADSDSSVNDVLFVGLDGGWRAGLVESWSTSERAVYDLRTFAGRTLLSEWRLSSDAPFAQAAAVVNQMDLVPIVPKDGATWSVDMGLRFGFRGELSKGDLLLLQFCTPLYGATDWRCEYEFTWEELSFDPTLQAFVAEIRASPPVRADPATFSVPAIPGLFNTYLRPMGSRGLQLLWRVSRVQKGRGIVSSSPLSGLLFDSLSIGK